MRRGQGRGARRIGRLAAVLLGFVLLAVSASAAEPRLLLEIGGASRSFTREELLDHPAAIEIAIPRDASYRRPMRYRAVPLAALLAGMRLPADQVLEAVAADGFVAALPAELILQPKPDGAAAYLAIEPGDAPWPHLAGKTASAGPFYIVWQRPAASGIRGEQWPYMVVAIRSADSPARRWPALAVDARLPPGDPVRAGQALFVTQCLVCHELNGAGSAAVGPDLNLPRNPTEYFKDEALHQYIRDPASLRRWSAMQMKGFDREAMSDREIDLVIAYLRHMAQRKVVP